MSDGTTAGRQNVRLNAWDREAMCFLRSVGCARPHQVAVWTGCSMSQVKARMGRLAAAGLAIHWTVSMKLETDGRTAPRPVRVWALTKRGTGMVGPIELPGSFTMLEHLTHLKEAPLGTTFTHGVVTVEHLLHWRVWGAEIVTEREMAATEKDLNGTNQRASRKPKHWIATRPDAALHAESTHAPDAGAVLGDASWQIEVELACKDPGVYRADLEALLTGPHRVVWYVDQPRARERLITATRAVTGGDGTAWDGGRWRSDDQRVVIMPLLGRGPVDGERPSFDAIAYGARLVHPIAGTLNPRRGERADLRGAWERRPDVAQLAARTRAAKASTPIPPVATDPDAELTAAALGRHTPPGTYTVAGALRTWDGQRWGAPQPLAA